MASCADFEPPRYAVSSGGRAGPETAETSHQARWCERATAYRSMLRGDAEVNGNVPTATDRGRTNALRRRLLLLRQPRPPTTKPAAAGDTLVRTGSVEQYIPEGLNIIFTRDAEYAWRPVDASEQYYRNREAMLRQYQTWNGIDIKKINLPLYPEPVFHKAVKISRKGRSWSVDDPAARQLSQRASRTPPVGRFGLHMNPARMTSSNSSANLPRHVVQNERDAFSRPKRHFSHVAIDEPFRQRAVVARVRSSAHTPPPPPPRAPPLLARTGNGFAADARSPTASPRQSAAEFRRSPQQRADGGSGGSVVRERSVRFSDELTVHEHSNNHKDDDDAWREATADSATTATATRTRAMTAVLLSQRQPLAGGRAEYVEKLRKKSRRQFLHALDRVIARLKRAKLGGGGGESPRHVPSDLESASGAI